MTGFSDRVRIGIFGGTFDPIHYGHLRVALEVMEGICLNSVIFVPAGIPPHKSRPDMANSSDRLEMVRFACEGQKCFEVSSLEVDRSGPSYTVDTLSLFSSVYGDKGEIFFIIGMDAFLQFHTWREPEKILGLTSIVVITRPGWESGDEKPEKIIEDYLRKHFSGEYVSSESGAVFTHPSLGSIHYLRVTGLDISGTRIRQLAVNGKSLTFLVPEKVEEYIVTRGLYT